MQDLVGTWVFVMAGSGKTRSIAHQYPLARPDINCLISKISKRDLKAGIHAGAKHVHRLYRGTPAGLYFALMKRPEPAGLLLDPSGDRCCVGAELRALRTECRPLGNVGLRVSRARES